MEVKPAPLPPLEEHFTYNISSVFPEFNPSRKQTEDLEAPKTPQERSDLIKHNSPKKELLTAEKQNQADSTSRPVSRNQLDSASQPAEDSLSLSLSRLMAYLSLNSSLFPGGLGKRLKSSFNGLFSTLERLGEGLSQANDKHRVLEIKCQLMEQTSQVIQTNLKDTIQAKEAQNEAMKGRKVLTKEDVLSFIKEEFDNVKASHEEKLRKAEEELEEVITKNLHLTTQLSHLEQEMKSKEAPKLDKGVQFTINSVHDLKETGDIKAYFESVNSFLVGGQIKTKEWALLLITDILSQKLWSDYQDSKQARPYGNLKEFTVLYFLKLFGCRKVALGLLRDFLVTMKAFFIEEQRIDTFMDLCGLYELKHIHNLDLKVYIEMNKVD